MTSGLSSFRNYIGERKELIDELSGYLDVLLQKYQQYFAELSQVRENELQQIAAAISSGKEKLPAGVQTQLDQALREARKKLDEELEDLRAQAIESEKEAEALRQQSLASEKELRKSNVDFDVEEEALKKRNQAYLDELEQFNQRIASLGRGLGFFLNLFKMNKLNRQRHALIEQNRDLAARIEQMRSAWQDLYQDRSEEEQLIKQDWLDKRARASALRAKIEQIEAMPERLVQRSALEKILFVHQPKLKASRSGDPLCPRCQLPNNPHNHFCRVCAQRLQEDRLDLLASLDEVAELNFHFTTFSAAMKSSQTLQGMLHGMSQGLKKFKRSIEDMLDSQRTYDLPYLSLDVPAPARRYGEHFDALADVLRDSSRLTPQAFLALAELQTQQALSPAAMQDYFESMGQELSHAADSQW